MSLVEPAAKVAASSFQGPNKPPWLHDFVPRRFLSNGHLQTIVGNFLSREYSLPEPDDRWIEVEPATSDHRATELLCRCHWQPSDVRSRQLTVLLLHGLEGSSSSQYVLGNASRLWAAGCNVVRMNMRSCGGGEEHSPTLYHSGRSVDVGAVVAALVHQHSLESVALVGYSMGGNMVLKFAGELSSPAAGAVAEPQHLLSILKAVVGVSPLMDLSASSDALHELQNRVYERRFLGAMLRRFGRKAELFPQIYSPHEVEKIGARVRTMRDFDEHIVARYSGFTSADDYYARVSSSQFASQIAVPTLVLHALDDPFIRMLPETRSGLLANPSVMLVEPAHGGHCAFLSRESGNDGYWAETTLLGFLMDVVGSSAPLNASIKAPQNATRGA